MSDVSRAMSELVVARAGNRCEYYQLSQVDQEAVFHIDHVVPRAADGPTSEDNLALACVSCALRKWAKQTGLDPESGEETRLFNPRTDVWGEHFRWEDERLVPLTAIGRATALTLAMNRPVILFIRREEMLRDRHPPS